MSRPPDSSWISALKSLYASMQTFRRARSLVARATLCPPSPRLLGNTTWAQIPAVSITSSRAAMS